MEKSVWKVGNYVKHSPDGQPWKLALRFEHEVEGKLKEGFVGISPENEALFLWPYLGGDWKLVDEEVFFKLQLDYLSQNSDAYWDIGG